MKIILDTKNDSKEEIEALITFLNAILKKSPDKRDFEPEAEGFVNIFGSDEKTNSYKESEKSNEKEGGEIDFYEGVQLY
ncbi:MAG: hypothetical protein QXU20_02555 [Candidatus Woesearchaeota archaeon]